MAIHADKLHWLFWLRWKTLMRGYTRRPLSIIGAHIRFALYRPGWWNYRCRFLFCLPITPSSRQSEVLYLVLTAVLLLWIVLPLLEFTANEGLDASKLVLFPLTRARS